MLLSVLQSITWAISLAISSAHALSEADLAFSPLLEERATFVGGYALVVVGDCPKDTFSCSDRSCCKNGQYCDSKYNGGYSRLCCPSEKNSCYTTVRQIPACADPGWALWNTTKDPICCQSGDQGTQPVKGQYIGNCLPADVSVPDSEKATKIGNSAGGNSAATGTAGSYSPTSNPSSNTNSNSNSNGTPTPSPSHSGGIGGGVIGGIVGGCVIFLLALAGFFYWLHRRSKQKHQKQLAEMNARLDAITESKSGGGGGGGGTGTVGGGGPNNGGHNGGGGGVGYSNIEISPAKSPLTNYTPISTSTTATPSPPPPHTQTSNMTTNAPFAPPQATYWSMGSVNEADGTTAVPGGTYELPEYTRTR